MEQKNKSFEEILDELKTVVSELENNQLPLDLAIANFEKGINLTKQAEQQLQDIKNKVTKIVQDNKISDFSVNE
ncbi:putative exodeoxyribonuclease vII small subunit protein [Spiroplasma syrphidicola EA-1]|uniref:Exodeoxyribonuclease 7 small subunit n=1 Tax=Spiroplasma syrphidicola EA-1 TaxID=1276229 RepID=R4UJ66_9MOLU|nr:exodeoxyribonuclease VII small subunit [Spiroplasma syrphidicola]AGM26165.1 putative exodeoxyribonuclease vII small subunit protein [Spiroplasma syrphidicola EA-1]